MGISGMLKLLRIPLVSWAPLCCLVVSLSAQDGKPRETSSQEAYERGQIADEAGHRDAAMAAYSEAIKTDAKNAAAWRARGLDYLADARYAEAVADLTQAIELETADRSYLADQRLRAEVEGSYKARGLARAALGQHREAILDFGSALNLQHDDEPVFVDRALSYIALGDLQSATTNGRPRGPWCMARVRVFSAAIEWQGKAKQLHV